MKKLYPNPADDAAGYASSAQTDAIMRKTPVRVCRNCTKKLPVTKYFYHDECRPKEDYLDWAELKGISTNGQTPKRGSS